MRPAKCRYSSPVSRSYRGSSSGRTPITRLRASRSRSRERPSMVTSPAVGRSRPVSILMVVLLPAPLGPRKPKKRPRGTSKERSSTATFLRKALVRWRTTMAGPPGGLIRDEYIHPGGGSTAYHPAAMRLDELMPAWDVHEVHGITVHAPPEG